MYCNISGFSTKCLRAENLEMTNLLQRLRNTITSSYTGSFTYGAKARTQAREELPYCAYQIPDGRFLLLNRQYKPIGHPVTGQCSYEDFYDAALPASEVLPEDAKAIDGTHYYYKEGSNTNCPLGGRKGLTGYLHSIRHLLSSTGLGQAAV